MPKETMVNSFDRATVSPYSTASKLPGCDNYDRSFPHVGDEKEWEEARCPICMEHPHNAVLILCSSHEKGCSPFICDTSYRHSNCLDQFRKSAAALSSQALPLEHESELLCPLCRGAITGWNIVQPARRYMDSRIRSCSLETCSFSGNYMELRKHARLEHPSKRPSEASPTRQLNWAVMERQRDIEDALAYDSDIDYDLNFLGDEDFLDFDSGMYDVEDSMVNELFLGISVPVFSICLSSSDEEMNSGSSRSNERLEGLPLPTNSNRISSEGLEGLPSLTNSGSTSNNEVGSMSFSPHIENGVNISRLTSSYQRENNEINIRSRSSYDRENNLRHSYHRDNVSTILSTRSSYNSPWNDTNISRSRLRNHRENALSTSQVRSSYYPMEHIQPSSRSRPSYYHREVAPSVTRQSAPTHLPASSRQRESRYYHGNVIPSVGRSSNRHITAGSSRQSHSRYYQLGRSVLDSSRRSYTMYYRSNARRVHNPSRRSNARCVHNPSTRSYTRYYRSAGRR